MRTPAPEFGAGNNLRLTFHNSFVCHIGAASITIRKNDRLTGHVAAFRNTNRGRVAFIRFTSVRLIEEGLLLNPPANLKLCQQVEVKIMQLQQFGASLLIDLALVPAAKK